MLYRFREVTCKQGFTTGTWYYLYNGLGVGDNMRISSLMASELEFELTSFRVQMKKKWVRNRRKRFYGNMWVNAVGREETWDSLCRMVLWKLLNTCGWIFGPCLLLQLKSRSRRGVFGLDIVSKCGIRGGGCGGERYYGEVGAVYLSGQRYRLKVRSVVQGYVGGLLRLGGEPGWCSYKNLLENGSF